MISCNSNQKPDFKLIVDRRLTERRSTAEIEDEAKHHREAGLRATRAAHHHPVAKGDADDTG